MGTSLPALAASSVLQLIPCSSRLCQRAGNPQLSFARSFQPASPSITTLFRSHVRDASSCSFSPRRGLCLCASASARASSVDVSVAEAPGADSPSHASSADAQQAGENGTATAADPTALTFQDAIQRLQVSDAEQNGTYLPSCLHSCVGSSCGQHSTRAVCRGFLSSARLGFMLQG